MIWLYRTPNMFFFSSEFLDLDSARVVLHNTKFKIILFSYRALELSAHSWSYVPEMTILGASSLQHHTVHKTVWKWAFGLLAYILILIYIYLYTYTEVIIWNFGHVLDQCAQLQYEKTWEKSSLMHELVKVRLN